MTLTNINGTPINTIKVYVLVPSTVTEVYATTVLNQFIPIYLNNIEGDITPATEGIIGAGEKFGAGLGEDGKMGFLKKKRFCKDCRKMMILKKKKVENDLR